MNENRRMSYPVRHMANAACIVSATALTIDAQGSGWVGMLEILGAMVFVFIVLIDLGDGR